MNRRIVFVLALMAPWLGLMAQEKPQPSSSSNYVIQASDVLRLLVFQEPDLTQEFRVPQDGRFHFPLIGEVDLTGKTISQAEDILTERYNRDYLVNPQINLLVIEFSERRVNVVGAVNQQGTVIFPPQEEMTLLDAIARAGGFTRLARKSAVTLTRIMPNGEPKVFVINVDEIVEGDAASVWKLQKDDLINVPERIF